MNKKWLSQAVKDMLVRDSLEANAYYNGMSARYRAGCNRPDTLPETANNVIAEAYLMRVETLTKGE